MSAILAPFGFRPNFHPSGGAAPRMKFGSVETPPTHSLYDHQPLAIDSNGNFQPAATYSGTYPAFTPTGVLPVKAIFAGIEYSDQNGFVHESMSFLQGQPTFNSAGSGVNTGNPYSTWVKPYVYQDPQIEYQVQFNGSVTQTAVGQTFDIDFTTIDNAVTTVGLSQVALDNTPVAASGGNFVVTDLLVTPNNQWGDAYPIVLVKLNLTQF